MLSFKPVFVVQKNLLIGQMQQYANKQYLTQINMEPEDSNPPVKAKSIPKSSLNPLGGQKTANIQYRKETGLDDKPLEISDQEKQDEMNKMREEYIMEKLNRKKQLIKIKKQQFGSSSSEQDDVGAEESSSGHSEEISQNIEEKIRENTNYQSKVEDEASPLSKPQKVYQLKGKQNWNQQALILKQKSLFLDGQQLEIIKIHKIKSIPSIVSKNLLKLKVSINSQDIMLAAAKQSTSYKKQKLSLHYIVFASIITRKLQMMGLKFSPLQKTVPGVPQSVIKNCMIYGKIFKKSQILGRWQQRLIVINQLGMYSYKRFNEQHSMFISANSVKQIWTRFEIVDQNLLVVKILHSSNTKTEFGIPMTDFMNQKNWLFQFYLMGILQAK